MDNLHENKDILIKNNRIILYNLFNFMLPSPILTMDYSNKPGGIVVLYPHTVQT